MDEHEAFWQKHETAKSEDIPKKTPAYSGCVYVIEYGDFVKIGCTHTPRQRLRGLECNARLYGETKTGRVWLSVPHVNYTKNETLIHRALKERRVSTSELFDIPFDDWLELIPKEVTYDCDIEAKAKRSQAQMIGLMNAVGLNGKRIYGGDET